MFSVIIYDNIGLIAFYEKIPQEKATFALLKLPDDLLDVTMTFKKTFGGQNSVKY